MSFNLPQIRTGEFPDDAQINSWASQAVRVMFETGILSGRGGGYFDPQGGGTRAEVVTMLRNVLETTANGSPQAGASDRNTEIYIDRRAVEAIEDALNTDDDGGSDD